MKPIQVSVEVPHARGQVYEFLAVSANHEPFNSHMLTDWSYSGPPRGIGSKTHASAVLGGRRDPVDIEVVDVITPARIVELNTGAGGKRVATGTYSLAETDTGTLVTFQYAWQRAPLPERLAAPIVRRLLRKALDTSMQNLASTLAERFARLPQD